MLKLTLRGFLRKEQSGAALLECAISLPLLIVLLLGLFDICTLMLNAMNLEQAAREGARLLSKMPNVETGLQGFDYHNDFNDKDELGHDPRNNPEYGLDTRGNILGCNSGTLGTNFCNNVLVHSRIRDILRNQRYYGTRNIHALLAGVNPERVRISSRVTYNNAANLGEERNTVAVSLEASHRGFLFFSWPLRVAFRAPYLFQRTGTSAVDTGSDI